MKTVLPSSEFKQYRFVCSKCGAVYWFTETQVTYPRFVFVCDCGNPFKPRLSDIEEKQEPIPLDRKYQIVLQMMVVTRGMSPKIAKDALDKIYNESKSLEQLLMEAIYADSGLTAH